jgi:hypothetical protein
MRSLITFAAAVVASVTFSQNANSAPPPRAELNAADTHVLPIHGCHRDWEEGWSNVLRDYLVHRHGKNCRPEARRWEHDWRHGYRNYGERDWRYQGPPPGWRRYDYDRGAPPPRRYYRDG